MSQHTIISGTGRCGTSFLVELLTHLELDTGFSSTDIKLKNSSHARAGLELDILSKDAPYIIKSPWLCDNIGTVIESNVTIDHVFIPVRDIRAAAESRRYVSITSSKKRTLWERLRKKNITDNIPGGLWYTESIKKGEQEQILLNQVYKLILELSKHSIPVTLLNYPKITKNSEYLYHKLKPILASITLERFNLSYNSVVKPELVHKFNDKDC